MPIRLENRDRYPENWPEISAWVRFERAQSRCECEGECGRGTHGGRCPNRHGQPAYGTRSTVVLTTAHLDHTQENCDPDNLKALCQGCHLHYDRDHHRETRAQTKAAALAAVGQGVLFCEMSPGSEAIVRWSAAIHGKTSDRHAWAVEAARLLDEHGPDAELPPFPSPHKSTRKAREQTARMLHQRALSGGIHE